jgi:hypothetical protein
MMHEAFRTFLYGFRHDAHPMAMRTGMFGSLAAFYHGDLDLEDPDAGAPPPKGSNVIDLMAALKKSLGDEKKGKKLASKTSKKEPAKAPARKRA